MSRMKTLFAGGLAAAALCTAARAAESGGEPFAGAVSPAALADQRGGSDPGGASETLLQGNSTNQSSSNSGSITIGDQAAKLSGSISAAAVNGNRGLTTVMQNTGDLVNLSNATSINIYLR